MDDDKSIAVLTEVDRVLDQWLTALRAGGDRETLTSTALFALAEAGAPSDITREVARLGAIAAVDKKIKQGEWSENDLALLKAARTMLVANTPPEEIMPLIEIQRDHTGGGRKRSGRKPRKLSYRTALAIFAAAVTTMKSGQLVDDVIAEVATPNGIDRKELKNFRDRLNRGLIDGGPKRVYRLTLAAFQRMTRAEIMSVLSRTSERFCT
jgi:hypothetical protein